MQRMFAPLSRAFAYPSGINTLLLLLLFAVVLDDLFIIFQLFVAASLRFSPGRGRRPRLAPRD